MLLFRSFLRPLSLHGAWLLKTLQTSLLVWLTVPAVWAGQVEVVVQDDDGQRLSRLIVLLVRDDTLPASSLHVSTDGSGLARFTNLPPATYRVVFPNLPEPLLTPKFDPYQSPALVTLRSSEETIRLDLFLRRGIPVEVTALVNGAAEIAGQVLFRHRASGHEIPGVPREIGGIRLVRQMLTPGLWDVHLEPRPGLLLVGLDQDTSALAGHQAALDLALDPFPTNLTWHFVAPCRIEGRVSTTGGKPTQARMVATLIEPGSWIEAARQRGGSNFDKVSAGVERNGFYEMQLPDGVWRVAPTSPLLESSSPPSLDLRLGPDETGNANFHVILGDNHRSTDSIMIVHVNNRNRRTPGDRSTRPKATGALVEVYQDDEGTLTPEPVTTKKVTRNWARFMGLEKGDYLVAAHHDNYLEESVSVPKFTAIPTEARHVSLDLSLGGQWRFEAFDVEGKSLSGVHVSVTRQGELPALVTTDSEFVAAKRHRRATTDRSGRAHMTGFYPGLYRVTASMPGQSSRVDLLDLARASAPDQPLGSEIEVSIQGTETIELKVHQRPAAALHMTLVCTDGWVLPEAVAVSVLSNNQTLTDPPFIKQAGVPLEGDLRDRLSVGPLPVGAYRLAIQPVGFDRTSWAFGSYEESLAQEIQVAPNGREASEVLDLGEFDLECGPAVDIVPETLAGLTLPDLRDIEIAVRLFDLEQDPPEELSHRLGVSSRQERFEIRNLPRGRARVDFTLSHPHFLPTPDLHWEVDVELERGAYAEVAPYFEQIGGAIQVKTPGLNLDGGLARLMMAGEAWTDVALENWAALFPSLVAGVYEVVLCADDACDPALGRWPEVTVVTGETVLLTTAD